MERWNNGRQEGRTKEGWTGSRMGVMSNLGKIFFLSYINYNIYKIILYKKVIE
jgi:hypothetical protein